MKTFTRLLPASLLLLCLFACDQLQAQCNGLNVTITPNHPPPFCAGETLTLTAVVTGGTTPYQFEWESGETTPTVTHPVTVGFDYFGVTVIDANDCTDYFEIKINPSLVHAFLVWGDDPVCAGTEMAIGVETYPLYIPGVVYQWSTGDTGNSSSISASGVYSVTVTDTNTGCSLVPSEYIPFPGYLPAPDLQIIGPAALCEGQSAVLSLTGGPYYTQQWAPIPGSSPTLNITSPGTYTVSVLDFNLCAADASLTIAPGDIAPPQLSGPANLCAGQSGTIQVDNSGDYNGFQWSNGATTPSITVTLPGTYTVTVSEAGGCAIAGTYTVTGSSNAPSATASGTAATCGQANGSINLVVGGGGAPYDFSWSNGASSEDLFGLVPGAYTVTVTGTSGCSATATATVLNTNLPINLSAVSQPSSVCAGGGGSINLTASPAGNYSFLWSNGATTEDISGLSAGTYAVTVTNGLTCTATGSYTVSNSNSSFTATYSTSPEPPWCPGDVVIVTAEPIGGTGPYTYAWSTGATTQSIEIIMDGTFHHFVTITDANGCTAVDIVHIKPSIYSTSFTWPLNGVCEGDSALLLVHGSGVNPYSYLWETGATTQGIYITQAGNYSVTLTDNVTGCTRAVSADIPLPIMPGAMPAIDGPSTLCAGQNATLTVDGGPFETYAWSPGGQSSPTLNINGPGTYTVTVTNQNLCTGIATLDIAPGQTDPPDLTGPGDLCPGQSASISIANSGSYTSFQWSTGQTTASITVTQAATYFVTVTAPGGCTATGSFTVDPDPNSPVLNTSVVPASCGEPTGAVDLTVSPAGSYVYQWSNGLDGEDLDDVAAGNYTVTVTGAGGCSATTSATVPNTGVNMNLSGSETSNTSCVAANGSIDLTVSPAGAYTFEWSNDATTEDLVDLGPGLYTVTVSAGGNCTASASFTVSDDSGSPAVNFTETPATCGQNNGAIDAQPGGGAPPFTFNWSNGASTQDLSNVPAGNYLLTITDADGCSTTAATTVTNNNLPISLDAFSAPNTACNGGNGSIDLSVSPAGAYTFQWSNGSTSEDLANLSAGAYEVTVTTGLTCTATAGFTVTSTSNAPGLDAVATPALCGLSNGAVALSISGGTAPFAFSWSNGAATEDLNGLPAGNYTVTATGADGCTASIAAVVPNDNLNIALDAATTPNTLCNGSNGSIDLNASPTGAYTFLWSNGATSEDLANLSAGDYVVTVTTGLTCTATAGFTVTNTSNAPGLDAVATPALCGLSNGAVALSISGGTAPFTFSWSNGAATEDLNGLPAGNYTVTATGADGCTSSIAAVVPNDNLNIALDAATTPNTFCNGSNGSIDLNASPAGAYTFLWSNGATSEDLASLASGNYAVTVTFGSTCTATGSFTVGNSSNAPSLATTTTPALCGQNNGAAALSPTGGTNPLDFLWSNGDTTQSLNNIPAGNYTVTVTGADGCAASTALTVADSSLSFSLAATPLANTSCTSFNGALDLSVSPAGAYAFTWSNGAISEDLNGLAPGSYTVIATVGTTCLDTATYLVPDSSGAAAILAAATPASCGLSNGGIDLSVAPATGNIFLWSNGTTGEDLPGVAAGDYAVTVTASNGCTSTQSTTVPENNPVFSISGQTTPNTACTASNGSISIAVVPAGAYSFQWSNGATTDQLSNLAAGVYTVVANAGGNCTATAAFTVPDSTLGFFLAGIGAPNTHCTAPNGALDLSVSPVGVYTFQWSNGATSEDLANLPAGDYAVTVTNASNCQASATYNVSDAVPALVAGGTTTAVSCFGDQNGAIAVTVSGGNLPYTFNWSPNLAGDPQQPTGLTAGTYALTITDAAGCTATSAFTVTQPAAPLALACAVLTAPSVPGATDGAGTVTANGGVAPYTLSWFPGGGSNVPMTGATHTLNNLPEGNYDLTVTDANGCATTCGFTLDSQVAACSNAVGEMQTAQLSACGAICLTAMYDAAGEVLSPDADLQFILHQGNGNQVSGEIARNTEPVFCFDPASMQYGQTYYISAVAGPTDANGAVIVTDNCTQVSLGTPLVFYEKPVVAAMGENITCQHEQAVLTGTASLPGVSFQWSATSSGILMGSIDQPTALATAAGTYTLIVAQQGCADTATVEIADLRNNPAAGITSASGNVLNCLTDEVVLTGSFSGTDNASIAWMNGSQVVSTALSITVIDGGAYAFVVIDTVTFCADTTTVEIVENQVYPPLSIAPPATLTCKNPSTILSGSSTATGVQFAWVSIAGSDTIALGAGGSLSVTAPGTYWLLGSDPESGCQNTISTTVLADTAPPTADAGGDQVLDCHETPVTLGGSASPVGLTFSWSATDPAVSIANPNAAFISVSEAGLYTLIVERLDNGCRDTATVEVLDYLAGPQPVATATSPTCHGDRDGSIHIEADPAHAPYQFSVNGSAAGASPDFTALPGGTYALAATDVQGCAWNTEITLPDPAVLTVGLGADLHAEYGETIILQADVTVPLSALDAVLWMPDTLFDCPQSLCLEQEFVASGSADIEVTVIDTNGCVAKDRVNLAVRRNEHVYIPNVFSPNDDGDNDVFTVFANEEVQEVLDLRIYDRWGEYVFYREHFQPNDLHAGWDGVFEGKPLNPAVFVYWALVRFKDGSEQFYSGDVTLVR